MKVYRSVHSSYSYSEHLVLKDFTLTWEKNRHRSPTRAGQYLAGFLRVYFRDLAVQGFNIFLMKSLRKNDDIAYILLFRYLFQNGMC